MDDEAPEGAARAYFVSSLHPKHSQQPTARRRHSGPFKEGNSSRNRLSSYHGRSRTDSNSSRGNDGYHHPLTPAQNGFSASSGITRPHLTSTISQIGGEALDDGGSDSETINRKEQEKVVIVHPIMPTDSLAGVSLKYGISLADLRRVNHLWANDPIHLRKELYIPVDKSSRAPELIQEMRLNSAPLIDLSTSSSSQTSDDVADTDEVPASPDTPAGIGIGVQRVPMSRLSFFPPPSTSGKMPSISSTQLPLPSIKLKPPLSNSRHPTSTPLASILTALPIAASTRDDLLARLSFESTSSSFSDRPRLSFEEHLEGHELGVISNHNESNDDDVGASTPSFLHTPRTRHQEPRKAKSPSHNTQPHRLSATPPAAYIPQIPDRTAIRTVQMEPSPIMQLPMLRPRNSRYLTLNGNSSNLTNVLELQSPK